MPIAATYDDVALMSAASVDDAFDFRCLLMLPLRAADASPPFISPVCSTPLFAACFFSFFFAAPFLRCFEAPMFLHAAIRRRALLMLPASDTPLMLVTAVSLFSPPFRRRR